MTSRILLNRRSVLRAGAGMAGIIATGRRACVRADPARRNWSSRTSTLSLSRQRSPSTGWPRKRTARSNGALDVQFFGKTLIPQELEIMNAVKSGSIAMGSPAGAAATVFPEMGALLVPYLVKDYASGLRDAQRQGRRQAQQGNPGQVQAQGALLSTTTASAISGPSKKPIIEPTRPARREDSRAAGQGVRRHHQWPRRQRRSDGLGRGHHGRKAGRDRRRRPADRQHRRR